MYWSSILKICNNINFINSLVDEIKNKFNHNTTFLFFPKLKC